LRLLAMSLKILHQSKRLNLLFKLINWGLSFSVLLSLEDGQLLAVLVSWSMSSHMVFLFLGRMFG